MKMLLICLVMVVLLVGSVLVVSGCQQSEGLKARESGNVITAPSDNTGANPTDNGSEWYGSD